jgi:hypothetical protein
MQLTVADGRAIRFEWFVRIIHEICQFVCSVINHRESRHTCGYSRNKPSHLPQTAATFINYVEIYYFTYNHSFFISLPSLFYFKFVFSMYNEFSTFYKNLWYNLVYWRSRVA